MDKKEKQLVKALKLAGIDKEKFDQVIDLFQEDEDETKEVKKEETQQEQPKEVKEEKPKVEEVKQVEQKKVEEPKDETKEVINKLLEKITALEEKVEKSQSFGYNAQPSQPSNEDVDDILTKMKNLR